MTRALVAAVAVVVLAWLAVMERDTRLQSRALASGVARARAESDLRRAAFLNPDPTPDLARATVLEAHGRTAAAVALVRRVLAGEPDNLAAWNLLQLLTISGDPATARRAQAELIRLDPLTAPRRVR